MVFLKFIKPISFLIIVLIISGCGTGRIFDRDLQDFSEGGPYPATVADCKMIYMLPTSGNLLLPLSIPFLIIDIPIAIVVDTIFLPWDISETESKRSMRIFKKNTENIKSLSYKIMIKDDKAEIRIKCIELVDTGGCGTGTFAAEKKSQGLQYMGSSLINSTKKNFLIVNLIDNSTTEWGEVYYIETKYLTTSKIWTEWLIPDFKCNPKDIFYIMNNPDKYTIKQNFTNKTMMKFMIDK